DRHGDGAAQIAIAEQRMWFGPVRRITEIEAQEDVVHRRNSHHPHSRLIPQFLEMLRSQILEQIQIPALEARDCSGRVGRNIPDDAIESGAAAIVRDVRHDFDMRPLLAAAHPDSAAAYNWRVDLAQTL